MSRKAMLATAAAIVCLSGLLGTGAAYGYSVAACHKYMKKVGPQLNACMVGNKACLEAPFKHALDFKNYGGKYQLCENLFNAEVNTRFDFMNQSMTAASNNETPALPVGGDPEETMIEGMAPPEMLPSGPLPQQTSSDTMAALPAPDANLSPECKDAYNFLAYATQSCKHNQCVDQQFHNSAKIPAFGGCFTALGAVRDARKAALPSLLPSGNNYYYYAH